MVESLFGGLIGGLFRLAPEVIKFFDRKDERQHELSMLDREITIATTKAEQAMHTVDAQVDISQFEAIGKALDGQAQMAVSGGKFVSGISALVRPLVTYWVVALWSAVKIASMAFAFDTGANWREVLMANWGADDNAVLSMVLVFWFVGRVYEGSGGRGNAGR